MPEIEPLLPDWPAPRGVRALVTTRSGGVSTAGYASLNLGMGSGDDQGAVAENRARLRKLLPADPRWLRQVHGIAVIDAATAPATPAADASFTRTAGVVCTVLAADCMPVLLADAGGRAVGVAHAGWRGLAQGVIERTLDSMGGDPGDYLAWLGPAISARHYEVGEEVRAAFLAGQVAAASAFRATRPGHWLLDLYAIARQRLAARGVVRVYGGEFCTYADRTRFFSHRRDPSCGRMAALIWLE